MNAGFPTGKQFINAHATEKLGLGRPNPQQRIRTSPQIEESTQYGIESYARPAAFGALVVEEAVAILR